LHWTCGTHFLRISLCIQAPGIFKVSGSFLAPRTPLNSALAVIRLEIQPNEITQNDKKHILKFKTKLLWIDGLGALVAGVVVLLISGWLSGWYGLPQQLLSFIGVVNVVYASYSISLALRSERSAKLLLLLVIANLIWCFVCLILAFIFSETATLFGLGHLVGEALYVGGLARLEWRWRELLRTA
jgi:uncharacterized membrane-anchored protein